MGLGITLQPVIACRGLWGLPGLTGHPAPAGCQTLGASKGIGATPRLSNAMARACVHPCARRDPFDVMQRKAALEAREDRHGAMCVPSLCSVEVHSYATVMQLLAKGNSNRAVRGGGGGRRQPCFVAIGV